MPMAAGPIRAMLKGMREMESSFAEARRTYAAMSASDRAGHVELLLGGLPQWGPEERKWLAALVLSDLLGMPPDLREPLDRSLR
jgi:hypothetical protein